MKTKRITIVLGCVFSGLLAAFLLHNSLGFLSNSGSSHAQQYLNQETKDFANRCPEETIWIGGGTFRIGADDRYVEEQSAEDVSVNGFCIDKYEVTNAEFAKFVEETGYVTIAERPLPAEEFPNLSKEQLAPGSLVFVPPSGNQPILELSWWKWVRGANWKHPEGPNSDLTGKENYPVVHVSYEDAEAYAKWAGKSLPTEAQWEFAARGGLKKAIFSWGNQYSADKANTWQGLFPVYNEKKDGYIGAAPVGSFPANGYGLYDMTGNVWEWTKDWYRVGHQGKAHKQNPIVNNKSESFDPREPGVAKHVIKGGSYLCAPNYCSRYRPSAREAQAPDSGTSHIGFRLVKLPGDPMT
ncbi:MAG: formylglycine-generating enzyme family protein [Oscillatoria sp. PMC 1051.18]|nr:formylglycine-generating enzyme family protein [Oscillatoria sp. PMC 1050.18]MEC5032443.1 formylglycine-generating enzyme family protein [Oscillatoria sp. PMC 1051.18]